MQAADETIRDTLAWDLGRGGPEKEGLDPAEERRLLGELAGNPRCPGLDRGGDARARAVVDRQPVSATTRPQPTASAHAACVAALRAAWWPCPAAIAR